MFTKFTQGGSWWGDSLKTITTDDNGAITVTSQDWHNFIIHHYVGDYEKNIG